MSSNKPEWQIPDTLDALIAADEDLIWETREWAPILLTVMGGTVYLGRPIPLAWQVEFEAAGVEFHEANEKVSSMGLDPNGYGWSALIEAVIKKYHSEIADELHVEDTEESTCVIWVESEETCRRLVDVIWNLVHE